MSVKTFKKFANNLTSDDIDLIDKLDNMDGCEITGELAEMIKGHKPLFVTIEEYIKMHINEYEDFIVEETESLYEQELIQDEYDFASGLYNCDEIYVRAILKALGILWLPQRL